MELKKFISESLSQICLGVREAQRSVSQETNNYSIAPGYVDGKPADNKSTDICFDIAITVTDDEKLNATGGVNLKIAKGDVEKENSTKIESIHRISFSIPFFPQALNSSSKKNKHV